MRLPLLVLNIAGGMVGLLTGMIAMLYRKGARGHRVAGNVFVVAMLVIGSQRDLARDHETANGQHFRRTPYRVHDHHCVVNRPKPRARNQPV